MIKRFPSWLSLRPALAAAWLTRRASRAQGISVNYSTAPSRYGAAGGFFTGGQSVVTDDEGRFVARGLLAGGRLRLFANLPAGGSSPVQEFAVKDANTVDLGDIVLRPR